LENEQIIVVISPDSPSIVATSDPTTALVLHASPSNVGSVIVNGEMVKENGKLLKADGPKLKHE
jgi:cytosine/adenosine deaminase-related metal-dependent hydrolase